MKQNLPSVEHVSASAEWLDHFQRSLARADIVGEGDVIVLTPAERNAIARSVQEFQLGESSEGRHLISAARRHAQETGDLDYVATMRLFIAEENRHARELGRVLDGAGIGRVSASWPDTVFRFLRRRAGLELSIVVLVTAEIIAKVYYAALRDATGCRPLRRLCEQILRDERHHVIFQAQRVALLRAKRSRAPIRLRVALHRFLLAGTCVVVWRKHGRAMRAGGMGFARFWRLTWREMNEALADMDPRNYPAPASERAKPTSGGGVVLACAVASSAASRLSAPRPGAPSPQRDPLQLTSEDVT
ncbi:MAG: ferritin-like domain-containing protein [Tepidisphaeraceae bacterium]